ncbi:MAG: peptidylprolyl isomerase [Campylobacteraceae bacterium]|nr:peptidylprolyl isomerase [Campylobacteraceae bacterium]
MNKSVIGFITGLTICIASLNAGTVYATVNGSEITSEDIALVIRNPKIKFDNLDKVQKDKLLNKLVDQKLLAQEAIKSGIKKNSEYKMALAKLTENLALEFWVQKKLKEIKVSKKEKQQFYNNNKNKFETPLQLSASHILVKTQDEAIALIKELDKATNKKETFTKLAKSKSVGPSGKNGGALGIFTLDKMVPEFANAANALKKGNYTKKSVKTQFGYHVIYLDDRMPAGFVKFEQVEAKISQNLLAKKFNDFLKNTADSLRKKSKIVIK